MARKSIELSKVIDKANHMLKNSVDELTHERDAIRHFVEGLLMDAGVYAGFNYLTPAMTEDRVGGTSFGMMIVEGDHGPQIEWHDRTRVFFHKHHKLA